MQGLGLLRSIPSFTALELRPEPTNLTVQLLFNAHSWTDTPTKPLMPGASSCWRHQRHGLAASRLPANHAIWISDSLLAHVFESFFSPHTSRSPRRYATTCSAKVASDAPHTRSSSSSDGPRTRCSSSFKLSKPCQVRFGSNVPGPLEARRRGLRRRMMGLAPIDRAGSMPDGGALMGGILGWKGTVSKKPGNQFIWQAPGALDVSNIPAVESGTYDCWETI